MSFNKGKIQVKPNGTTTKKSPTYFESRSLNAGNAQAWDARKWSGASQRAPLPYRNMNYDLNTSNMNLPEGYHMMPDGTIMSNNQMNYGGQPCYECGGNIPHMKSGGNWMADIKSTGQCTGSNFGGPNCRPGTREYAFAKRARSGEFHKQFGGDSKAPQNMTIDGIGQARTELMKNYLSANVYGSILDQEANRLAEMQQRFDDGGSVYNPNMYGANEYAGAIDATRKQFKKDWRNFGNAFQNVVNSYPQQQSIQQPIQPMGKVQSKQADFSNFNQNDPSLAIPDGGFAGVDAYMAYGGNMPMMADGGDDMGWVPGMPWNPLFTQLGYSQAEEEAKFRAKLAEGAQKYAPNTIPMQVDPSGGIGRSAGISNVQMPNVPATAQQDPTKTNTPTIQLSDEELKGINTEKDYWDAVTAKAKQQRAATKPNVSAATKKKAAQSTVGKTPTERRAIEEAQAKVTNASNVARGNVITDGKPSAVTSESYTANQGNAYGQPGFVPGYGGGRFKIKGVDPATGKRFKVKYDTAQSPRGLYGGRGPRVVKYDIYNNPVYAQPAIDPEAAAIANEVAPYEFNKINANINTPVFDPRFPQGQGGFGQGQQAWYSPTELGDLTSPAPAYFTEADYMNQKMNQPQLNINDYVNAHGVGNQMQNFRPRRAEQVPGEPTPSNLNERFMKQVDRDFRRGFNYGGDINVYPILEDGGAFNNQGSAFLNDDAYAANPDMKAKWKGNNQGFNQWAPMMVPGLNMISSIAEQGDARRNEAQLQDLKQASNVFTPNTVRNRGKNTVNQGYFDPYNMTPVQFAGNDQGAIGSPNVYSKYGGQPMYQDGGEYELTEQEIAQILAMGGQIEYL